MKTITIIFTMLFSITITAQRNAVLGKWQASNGTIMNFSGNKVSVAGDTYTYEIEGSYLSMYNQQGDVLTYTYQVKGNQLYLYLQGVGTYVLKRVGRGGAVSTSRRNTYNTNRTSSAGAERLYGSFCSYSSSGYSGSSSYSTTTRVTFDGRGHYTYGSESSYSGGGDGYYGGGGESGGTYEVVGNKGVILRANDGSVYKVAIHYMLNNGEITELQYDGVLYAKALCD